MDVILIGPIGAGKSTLGKLVAAALGIPQVSMDDIRFRYYEDEALLTRVKQVVAPHPNVVLVLPSADLATSLDALRDRRPFLAEITPDINEHFLTHRSNYELATFVVYTADRTAEETCAEILQRIAGRDATAPS